MAADERDRGPVVSDEARALVGKVVREFVSDPVSLRQIREYLVGIGAPTDHLPSGADADAIAGVVAPPMFFLSACRLVVGEDQLGEDGQHLTLGVPGVEGRSAVAGSSAEFHGELRVGDVLFVEERIAEIVERQGRSGPLVFVDNEMTFRNQRGELIAVYRMNVVFR